jgi:hypothetical protein
MALLGLAVFCWGLHSKLSLYQSASAQRGVPVAKILSEKERPTANAPLEQFVAGGSVSTITRRTSSSGTAAMLLAADLSPISESSGGVVATTSKQKVLLLRGVRTGPRAPPLTS